MSILGNGSGGGVLASRVPEGVVFKIPEVLLARQGFFERVEPAGVRAR